MERELIEFNFPMLGFNINSYSMRPDKSYRNIHTHSAIELVHINSGKIECIIEEKSIMLFPDDIMLINSFTKHRLKPVVESEIIYMQIDTNRYLYSNFENSNYINEFLNISFNKPYFHTKLSDELFDIFTMIKKEAENKNYGFELYIKSYIHLLAAYINRYLTYDKSNMNPKYLPELIPAIKYIEENFNSKIYLDDIANEIGITKFRLCKIFKSATSSTIVDYINFVRLKKAEEMLLSTDKNISEIAFDCGFSSIQYFNNIFKDNYGLPPGDYRKTKI